MREQNFPTAVERSIAVSIRIVKLMVMRTGTYNPMYYRPYETKFNADVADDLTRRLETNGSSSTTSSLMAGIANRIIMPAMQHEGQVPIVNGWATPRGRFNMTVEIRNSTGSMNFYHLQGYTSHYDLSHGGIPDPEMDFFVNSYVKVARTPIMTPNGIVYQDMVMESAQVIDGVMISSLLQNEIYSMRPSEIYSRMQTDMLGMTGYNGVEQDYLRDFRHSMQNQNIVSARNNNLPSNILSKMVDSYRTNQHLIQYGSGNDDVITRAKGYVYEGTIIENPFFRQLSNVTGRPETTHFKMKDLRTIDPAVDNRNVSSFLKLDQNGMSQLTHPGQSQPMHNPNDRTAWVASVLGNTIPTIMMDLMLTNIAFRATNYDGAGKTTFAFDSAMDMTGVNLASKLQAFEHRFSHEVMFDLTFGNQEPYKLAMKVDLLDNMVLDITYGSNAQTRFVLPAFCDGLITPVMTPNINGLSNTVHDFTQILNSVSINAGNSHQPNVHAHDETI